jgi:uncharacterized protein (DUF433 family)
MPSLSIENPLFTPTEAAVLTRLPLKAVNNAIDKKTVIATAKAGQGPRLLDMRALMSLSLHRRLADRFAPEFRRAVFDALPGAKRDRLTFEDGLLTIDLREPRRELAALLRDLRRARRLVHKDPDIMGGQAVFRGTRLSPHLIADLLEQGETIASLLEGYPSLTQEMARLAALYAAAYPERGRTPRQPWHGRPPVKVIRRRLASSGAT